MGKIEALISLVKRKVETLDDLVKRHCAGRVVEDYVLLNAALHLMPVAIQALIDAVSRLAAEAGAEPPAKYSDIPRALAQLEVLGAEEAALLRRVIGFRNVVVHGYGALDLGLVAEILDKGIYWDLLKLASRIYAEAVKRGIDP